MRGPSLLIGAVLAAGVMALAWPAPVRAEFRCVQLTDSRNSIICAPPRGQLLQNNNSKYVCGPGRCLTLSSGRSVCSAVPGGAIALDTRNRPLCYGGCVEPSESMCVTPIPDER